MASDVVLSYSGGLDSTILLYRFLAEGKRVSALGFNYGQRHQRETISAKEICRRTGVEYKLVDISALNPIFGRSALTNSEVAVPHGHYADATMKATVVPNRNMIFLSIAGAYAISIGAKYVSFAAHAGDHTIYPDCRPEFAQAFDKALGLADWRRVELLAPFLNFSKVDILRSATQLAVPLEITWSCYEGGDVHCGLCGTCIERKEAFSLAGLKDPTIYRE
ncbi:MAG: 7-cyano-7-deazaguanine synthase QueC [Oligoflexia bacterium]|nr:7-cyano-7-deazaguanine synthase QueC [Oligoflexia bacterium]